MLGRLNLAAVALLSISTAASAGTVTHILDTTGSGGGHGIDILSKDFAGTFGSRGDSFSGGPSFSSDPGLGAFFVSEFGSSGPSFDKGGSWILDKWGSLGGPGGGGDCHVTSVPEPRYLAVMLVGLLLIGSATYRKIQALRRANVYVNPQAQ